MNRIISLSAIAVLTIAISCNDGKSSKEDAATSPEEKTEVKMEEKKEVAKHWSYDGESSPEHWAEIEKESSCGGSHQSPIDIVTADALVKPSGLKFTDIHYDATTIIHDVTNNGHSIQYNFDDKENYVDFEGTRYDLAQIHFHAASEHSINGMHFPLVIHMVHVSKDKNYVVFAVMIREGKESNAFDFLETYLPVNPGETKTIGTAHHFNQYLLAEFDHYYYQGSLTTPPCTEAVNWFVFKTPLEASPAQVKNIADLMPRNNYRPTQALNGREVFLSE